MIRLASLGLPNCIVRRLFAVFAVATVAACSSTDVHDLEQFVDDTRTAQRGQVEPLPQFKPFETYAYAAAKGRDPFAPWKNPAEQQPTTKAPGKGPHPDFDRRKEPLEAFPLDSLRMVGTLAQQDGEWAIIRAPDNIVHRVKKGNYLGQNHGKIVSLGDNRIELMELIPDGSGGWQERQAILTLVE